MIKTSKEAGIRTISAHSYLVKEVEGFGIVGFIKGDCYNVVNKQNLINAKARDAQKFSISFYTKVSIR